MSDTLPRSVRRRAARQLRERENSLLDHFATIRGVQDSFVGEMGLLDMMLACEREGLEALMIDENIGEVFKDGVMIGLIYVPVNGDAFITPVE